MDVFSLRFPSDGGVLGGRAPAIGRTAKAPRRRRQDEAVNRCDDGESEQPHCERLEQAREGPAATREVEVAGRVLEQPGH